MQASSLSWLVGGEDESVESLVSLAGGGLCGALVPAPSRLTRGAVGGAVGGRVFVCGGLAGAGESSMSR